MDGADPRGLKGKETFGGEGRVEMRRLIVAIVIAVVIVVIVLWAWMRWTGGPPPQEVPPEQIAPGPIGESQMGAP